MNRLALPESGERKRNLTTTGLGEKQRKSETRPVPTKSSQSPLRIRSVQVEGVKELSNVRWEPFSDRWGNSFPQTILSLPLRPTTESSAIQQSAQLGIGCLSPHSIKEWPSLCAGPSGGAAGASHG